MSTGWYGTIYPERGALLKPLGWLLVGVARQLGQRFEQGVAKWGGRVVELAAGSWNPESVAHSLPGRVHLCCRGWLALRAGAAGQMTIMKGRRLTHRP